MLLAPLPLRVAFKFVYISKTYAHLLKTLKVSKPQNREEVRARYQIVNLSEPRLDMVGYQRTGDGISLAFAYEEMSPKFYKTSL